jgi:NADPH2 dehydrogenase
VSRYFKYKSSESLTRDAEDRGLRISLTDDLGPLRRPLAIGARSVGNRMVVQPMEGCDSEPDGSPGELTMRRYVRFGAGGAKLIWGEACAVVPEGRANPRQLLINDGTLAGLERMRDGCVSAHLAEFGSGADRDLQIGLQLTHSGRYSYAKPIRAQADPLLDPRTVMDRGSGRTAGPGDPVISDDELDDLVERYVEAARRAQAVGFTFVDIKQCHRYLLNELLAARERPGRYGGSFENRTRFVRSVVSAIRDACPDLIVATRMNVYDSVPFVTGADGTGEPTAFRVPVRCSWGTNETDPLTPDLEEPLRLVGELRALGVELFNVTIGNPYASPHITRPFDYVPTDGYQTPEHPLVGVDRHFRLAEAVQRMYPDLAVVGSGYSWLQAFALEAGAANVRDGRVSLVGIGRNALSHPDFARCVLEGQPLDRRRICRTFSYCTALMRSKHNALGQFPTGCPPFDKDVYGPIWQEARETAPDRPQPGEDDPELVVMEGVP